MVPAPAAAPLSAWAEPALLLAVPILLVPAHSAAISAMACATSSIEIFLIGLGVAPAPAAAPHSAEAYATSWAEPALLQAVQILLAHSAAIAAVACAPSWAETFPVAPARAAAAPHSAEASATPWAEPALLLAVRVLLVLAHSAAIAAVACAPSWAETFSVAPARAAAPHSAEASATPWAEPALLLAVRVLLMLTRSAAIAAVACAPSWAETFLAAPARAAAPHSAEAHATSLAEPALLLAVPILLVPAHSAAISAMACATSSIEIFLIGLGVAPAPAAAPHSAEAYATSWAEPALLLAAPVLLAYSAAICAMACATSSVETFLIGLGVAPAPAAAPHSAESHATSWAEPALLMAVPALLVLARSATIAALSCATLCAETFLLRLRVTLAAAALIGPTVACAISWVCEPALLLAVLAFGLPGSEACAVSCATS